MPERVLLLSPGLTALGGGIELHDRQLLEALAELWPRARFRAVLAREPHLARPTLLSEALQARLVVEGVRATSRTLRIAEFVARALAASARSPDLIFCGHTHYAALARTVAGRAPLVTMIHGVELDSLEGKGEGWTARALRASDLVLSVSAFSARQLTRVARVREERIVVVPNAVDVDRFQPGPPSAEVARALDDLPRPRLLTVARLTGGEAYKGVDWVIRALARSRIRASYLVVGEGSDLPRLRALAAELGVAVRFYGRAPDEELVDLYRACDLFVMPSRREGFGIVFIEAMACGLPVIAGSVDGSVEALDGGRLGLLVDPLDEGAIAEAIAAHLEGRSPPEMRDPAWLHAQMVADFSMAVFKSRLARALAPLVGDGYVGG